VNYHATAFVPKAGGLSQLKVNYGQYLFNQQVGWDSAHPR
jgi:ABC-type methionine transport system permease subunit